MNNPYLYSSEITFGIIAILFLFLMCFSKPRITHLLRLNITCVSLSILMVLSELTMSDLAMYNPLNHLGIMNTFVVITVALYISILACLVTMVNRLSAKAFFSSTIHHIIYIILFTIWIYGSSHMVKHGQMYVIEGGTIRFLYLVPYLVGPGLLAALSLFFNMLLHKNSIPRPVFHYVMFFVPLDLFFLILQLFSPNKIFLAITYVTPCCLFHILFHASIYDANTGCMGGDAFETALYSLNKKRKPYTLIYVHLVKFGNVEQLPSKALRKYYTQVYRETCRQVEYLSSRVSVFRIDTTTFALTVRLKSEEKTRKFIDELLRILRTQSAKAGETNFYKVNVFKQTDFDQTEASRNAFAKQILQKSMSLLDDCYFVTDEDYQKFNYNYRVEQLLYSIRGTGNLDDDRVKVLVQPIFSVSENKFKTGEALMRLSLDGATVFPDVFIPIAERTDTVHSLTKVIIYKTCLKAKEFAKTHALDAITVNCSSIELANPDFSREVLSIIDKTGVDHSLIRFELTESAMFGDFSEVSKNISRLNEAGIVFYLDDFGTGYSNLERITVCPLHTVKFDKSVLYRSMENESMKNVVETLINAFKKKGCHVLVEGVETKEQLDFCINEGFEFVQGYYYSKPVPIEEFEKWLS